MVVEFVHSRREIVNAAVPEIWSTSSVPAEVRMSRCSPGA
jgi:hypothetical protein